jgi:hypothetical protein
LTDTAGPAAPPRKKGHRLRGALHLLFGVVVAAVVLYVVGGQRGELEGALSYLSHLRWQWLVLAVTAEFLAIVSFGALQRQLLAAGLFIAACAAPRNTLGTSASPCFRALPTARTAVHQQGRFVGVRRVTGRRLRELFHTTPPAGREFCVVGFSGPFRPDQVDHAVGTSSGKYAVVVVTLRGTSALQTFLVDRLPTRLRHR